MTSCQEFPKSGHIKNRSYLTQKPDKIGLGNFQNHDVTGIGLTSPKSQTRFGKMKWNQCPSITKQYPFCAKQ